MYYDVIHFGRSYTPERYTLRGWLFTSRRCSIHWRTQRCGLVVQPMRQLNASLLYTVYLFIKKQFNFIKRLH